MTIAFLSTALDGVAGDGVAVPVSPTNPLPTVGSGPVTPGTAQTGSQLTAALYKSTLPTATDGQQVPAQAGPNGQLLVWGYAVSAAGADGVGNTTPTDVGPTSGNTATISYKYTRPARFNGVSWDREVKPSATSRIPSAANTTNATSAKASAGNVHSIHAYNTTAAVKYLKVYNKASAPTVGTDTPVMTFALQPNSQFSWTMPPGFYFSTGIAYALTGAAADADTTALTAGDVTGVTITYS